MARSVARSVNKTDFSAESSNDTSSATIATHLSREKILTAAYYSRKLRDYLRITESPAEAMRQYESA